MRKPLAGALVLIVTCSGLRAAGFPTQVTMQGGTVALAAPLADTGGGVVRTGTQNSPPPSGARLVQVRAIYDIFLAGRAYPFAIRGHDGIDVGGRNSPPIVPVQVPSGSTLTFTTYSGTSHRQDVPRAADAGGYPQTLVLAGPAERGLPRLGLSSLRAPIDSLVGVFLGKGLNAGRVPPTLDFGAPGARGATIVRPALNQVFFIGTGTYGVGSSKRFVVPPGAVRLALGSFDYAGGNHDNFGEMLVYVSGLTPVTRVSIKATVTATATARPTSTISLTPTPSFTGTPSTSPTPFPTNTPTNTPTLSPTVTPPFSTLTPTNTLSPSNTLTPSITPTLTNTPTNTFTPTVTTTPFVFGTVPTTTPAIPTATIGR